jgi:hypothetical protein
VLTTRGEQTNFYIILNSQCFPATRNHKGQVFITLPDAGPVPLPPNLSRANAWGKGYTALSMEDSVPTPNEFAFDNDSTKLDQLTIKRLTQLIYQKTKRKAPNAIKKWALKLAKEFAPAPPVNWHNLSQIYSSSFLTPKDFNLHFRHITHRGLYTRVRMNEANKLCRLCGNKTEHILHLGQCPTVICPFLLMTEQRGFKCSGILFAFPDAETGGIENIIILAWKFIIRHSYQNSSTPVAFTDHNNISKIILGRFAELALGWSKKIKRRIYTNSCRGSPLPNTLYSRQLLPLATIPPSGDLIFKQPAALTLLKKYELVRYIPNTRRPS